MATPDQEKYQSLISPDGPGFEDFFRIYAESIEGRERKPKALIARMISQPDYKVLVQKINEATVGFSILFAPVEETFCLLEYMAVHSLHRNSGLGRKLFLRTVQDSDSTRGEPLPVLLEVDSDREASADREMRRRRLQFYGRLGCLRVEGLSYVLPLLGEGPPPVMDLLVHLPTRCSAIRKSQLRRWLGVIYQSVYDCSPNDPRIVRMLEGISDPVKLAGTRKLEEERLV
jgi:GNAT superfamily N-acetyltransferase